MRYKILLFLSFVFGFAFDINELANGLKKDITGEFNQTKNIVGFERSIKSSGEFSLKDGEFILSTTKPIKNSTKINKNGIFILKNGMWLKNEQMSDTKLLLDILSVDIDALKNEFEINLSGDKNSWNIRLVPKGYFTAKIFKTIEI
ncbi:MAG: outer membrane lipoprotein carrier protein LolA, partial [Campylobacter sp.]|nr:outer membrane lipoprotein carrier protein LolA [Campylobacter sp.]